MKELDAKNHFVEYHKRFMEKMFGDFGLNCQPDFIKLYKSRLSSSFIYSWNRKIPATPLILINLQSGLGPFVSWHESGHYLHSIVNPEVYKNKENHWADFVAEAGAIKMAQKEKVLMEYEQVAKNYDYYPFALSAVLKEDKLLKIISEMGSEDGIKTFELGGLK